MSDEQKTVEETTEKPDDASVENESTQEVSEDSKTQDVDYYKKESELLQAKLDKAESKIVKMKTSRKQATEVNESDVQNNENIAKIVSTAVASELSKSSMEEAISKVSSSNEHSSLINYHLENSIIRTGDVQTDLRRAMLITDEKKNQDKIEILEDAVKSKNATQSAPANSSVKNTTSETTKYTDAELSFFKKMGVSDKI